MFRHKRHNIDFYSYEQNRCQHQLKYRRLDDFHRHYHDFRRHYKYFRYLRPAAMLFNLVILYLLFSWGGFKGIGIFFAALIVIKEIGQFF